MFCPNCGANLPDSATFCGNCGAPQKTQQPQQPVYQAPPQYRPATPPVIPMSKKEFLAQKADPATRKTGSLVTITLLISLVLIAASIFVPLTVPFFDIPAIDLLLTVAEADPDELIEELEVSLEELEDSYDRGKSTMDSDEREAAKKVIDSMDALIENFSVLNFKNLVSVTQKEGDGYMDRQDLEEIEQIDQIMTVVIASLAGSFLLPLVFALLGGLNKSTGLTVTALVFTVLSQLTLCGLLLAAASLTVYIVQAVLCSKVQRAYNDYRLGRTA